MKYDICIIGGAGRVGLPLSIIFALKDLKVLILDRNKDYLNKIKNGIFPFKEKNGEEFLKKALIKGNLFLSSDNKEISFSKNIIITVDTPLDNSMEPDYSLIDKLKIDFFQFIKNHHFIILRSTVFPGFTETFNNELKKSNILCELSYCPERIAEGNAFLELTELPQIISGYSKKSIENAEILFKKLTFDIIKVSVKEAELTKLFNNVYRYVKFATANQFFTIANDMNVDFYNVYKAMTYKYPRASDFPKAGFSAGPCLYKDTLQLCHFCKDKNFIGKTSVFINQELPMY
ncbi:MAG: nucleotide sugar dehydrogenase, partial [Candidatus Muirbacterium halophilum]|nr:nucleotide sugar dehydrogenase [Candidatus Muirbacterium halophilum]